jgi:hypothetical protein
MSSAELYAAALFAVQVGEGDVPRGRRHKGTGSLRPLDYENRAVGEVVLPADGDDVFLAMKSVEIHVDEIRALAAMFLHKAERGRSDAPVYAERGG